MSPVSSKIEKTAKIKEIKEIKKTKAPGPLSLTRMAYRLMDEKKALNLRVYHVRSMVSYTDYVLIATVQSTAHARSLGDTLLEEDQFKLLFLGSRKREVLEWQILDFGFLVIHLFTESRRRHYDLDELFFDAETSLSHRTSDRLIK